MTSAVRTVLGMPAYGRPDSLPQALESLLSQTRRDFAILIVDDAPSEEVRAIIERYNATDVPVVYEANAERRGMVGNWRHAFERARALYPRAEFFAWVSDHDSWHPRWLEVMVDTLDARAEVVLAFPQIMRVYPRGPRMLLGGRDTAGVASRTERFRRAAMSITAGNAIYGLFRMQALRQAGVFRRVLLPDRQLLTELALLGEFTQVPAVLWYREVNRPFSYQRQRQLFFDRDAPYYMYLPPVVQHAGVLLWDVVVHARLAPAVGRLAGLWFALLQLFYGMKRAFLRSDAGWRRAVRRLPGSASRDKRIDSDEEGAVPVPVAITSEQSRQR